MGETAKMKAALVLMIQILGLAPVVSALKNQAKRRFFDSFFSGSFFSSFNSYSDNFCFNSEYNSRTQSGQCENNCCWGDACGSEGECEMAVIIGCTIGAVIVLCICGCIFFCFCKKKMCFNNRSDSHQQMSYPEPQNQGVPMQQQGVQVVQPQTIAQPFQPAPPPPPQYTAGGGGPPLAQPIYKTEPSGSSQI